MSKTILLCSLVFAIFRDADIVSIDCHNHLRFEGSTVSGSIRLNASLAKKKDVVVVKVSLNGLLRMYFQQFISVRTLAYHLLNSVDSGSGETE
jgi:hypothetical protein